jgi:hypothetical protein
VSDAELRALHRPILERTATEADVARWEAAMLRAGRWVPLMVERRVMALCRRLRPRGKEAHDVYDCVRACARDALREDCRVKAEPIWMVDALAASEPDRVVLAVLDREDFHVLLSATRMDAYAGDWRWCTALREFLDAEAPDRVAAPREVVAEWVGKLS